MDTCYISRFVLCFMTLLSASNQLSYGQAVAKPLYIAGFEKGISGTDFNYRSPLPQNEEGYIIRGSFEEKVMSWQTATVSQTPKTGRVAFVFMAAMSIADQGLEYRLTVKGGEIFLFTNKTDNTWTVTGTQGGELFFHQSNIIPGVEVNGFMILSLPADMVKPNTPLEINISMISSTRSSWIIVYKKSIRPETTLQNIPVLVKDAGNVRQQIKVTQFQFLAPQKISFSQGGKVLLADMTKTGFNQFFVSVPKILSPVKVNLTAAYEDGMSEKLSITQTPAKTWEVYLVQHAHTDIGYTRPQSEILAEHLRYIDYALDYCDQTDSLPDDAKFRWTCESAWVVREYLRTRPRSQVERFKKRIGEGRIEVTGMYFNMAEIADENIMFDFFQPLKEIKSNGINVKAVMQDDVNGVAWCLPDYLKSTGIRLLNMGINETRSILPFKIPTCFWWEAPSGARLLAFRSDHYMTGNFFGLPEQESFNPDRVFEYLVNLERNNYPFDRISVQFSGYFTDNSPPSTGACEIIKAWNEKYESPKLRLSTTSEFFEYVDKNYSSSLPVYRKAWLDWWTDGYGSTSRETAEVRKVQNLKQVDEGLFAMVSMLGGDLSNDLENKLQHISENALFFDEHTCGADESVDHPFSENSTRQWLQKGAYAWEALKKVTLLNEDAMGRIQPYLKKASFPVIYVVNSMGWNRSGVVELFIDNQIIPPRKKFKIIDLASQNEAPVQSLRSRSEGVYWAIMVEDIPALGWKAFKIEVSKDDIDEPAVENLKTEILENQYYRLTFDKSIGAIGSLYDKDIRRDLVDPENPWKIGQLVRETLPDRNTMNKPSHSSVWNVKMEKGADGDLWQAVKFSADMDGFEKGSDQSPKGLEWEIRLYKNSKLIEFHFLGRKEILTDPEALYVTFPFSLPDSRIVFETIGGALTQGQQLPGSSSDWNVAQNYAAVRSREGQIIVVSNEIPLWQFGGFNMGQFERNPKPGKPWLYSWVMNNYWFTNFRAFQEGNFYWTYQLTTMTDTTNTAASRFAWGIRNPFPTRTFPAGKNELSAPVFEAVNIESPPNVMLVNSRPAFKNRNNVLLHIRETDGRKGEFKITSAIPDRPIERIVEVNILGEEISQPLHSVNLGPYEVKFIEIGYND